MPPLPVNGGALTASQAPASSPGWGWNPLTDFQKATGIVGGAIDRATSAGGLNLGLGGTLSTIANIVPGLANTGYQVGKDLVTGNYGAAGQIGANFGHGLLEGAANTFTDIGTLGGLAPWTHRWENEIGNVTHGYIQPTSLLDYATNNQYANGSKQGLLGGVLNDALNLTLVGDGIAKVGSLGEVGDAATQVLKAERAGKVLAADDIGKTLPEIQEAGEAAKAQRLTELSGGDAALAERIAKRAQLLESVESYKNMVNSALNPLNPLKTLGRAANELPEGTRVGLPKIETPPVETAPIEPTIGDLANQAAEGERQRAAAQQAFVQMQPHVKLYRGEGMDLSEGAGVPDTGPGHWFTDNREIAQRYADQSGGRVLEVSVPESVAEAARSHSMWNDRLQKEGTAYNLEEAGPQYTEQARQLAPPVTIEPTVQPPPEAAEPQVEPQVAPPEIVQRTLENVPAAYKSYLERSKPIPEWARTIVKHLPTPFVKLLQISDNLRQAREYYTIKRQTQVALNVVARAAENDPAIKALRERAQQLMTDRFPDITPTVASRIIGERIDAAMVLGPLWHELETLRPELEQHAPGLVDYILGFQHTGEWDTPEFRQEIEDMVAPIRELRAQHLEQLRTSPFFAEKGLDLTNFNGAVMTSKEVALHNQIQELIKEAAEKEAKGRMGAVNEITAKIIERSQAHAAALAPSEEGERLRDVAGRIESEGHDTATAQVIELRNQARAEVAEAARPAPEAAALREQDAAAEAQARETATVQARQARTEQARQLERAAGVIARRTGIEPFTSEMERQDAVNKAAQAGEEARALETQLAQPYMTDPALRDRADALDAEHRTAHTQAAVRLNQQAAQLEHDIENGTLGTDRQADMVRENARAADVQHQNTQAVAVLRANRAVKDLTARLAAHETPEEQAAATLRGTAAEKEEALAERMGNAKGKRVPPKWQPLTLAAKRLADAVEQYPELAPILESLPKTFGDALDYAAEHGFDPTHMPDLTPERVRQMVNGSVRLGGEPAKEFVSGARRIRLGTLREQGLADRSIEAVIAGLVHATQEDRTNMVVNWLDRAIAKPLVNGRIPEGWVAWDPIRRGLLSAENPEGEIQATKGGATRMIPKAVARAINEYSSTASNPLARAMQTITNPWRFFMLTLNPAFYLHHVVGHVMLALAQQEGGFHLSDWRNAFREARTGFENLPEVTGSNIVQAELGPGGHGVPGVVTYPNFRTALAQGGPREALNYISQAAHRAVAVSDSFARAVDYFSQKRTGATDMEALQHANTALVDYQNLSPFEKNVLRSIIPFYGFQKGILKIALSMPIDHPLVTQVLMNIGKIQTEQAVDANGNPLPTAYQGVVNLFGHNVNLKSMSPFKDIGALTTPEGLIKSLQFALQAGVHVGLNAPSPFTKGETQVGPYGTLIPRANPWEELKASLGSSPQAQLFSGLAGNSTKTPGQAALAFGGLPLVNQTTLNAAGQRNVLSEAEQANTTPNQQAAEVAFPVDTNTAQNLLAQASSQPGGPLVPKGNITPEQVAAALLAAQQKQKAAAAQTRATGITKSGVHVKRRKGGGGGSHRLRRSKVRSALRRHAAGGKVHVHKVRVSAGTRSRLRAGFGASTVSRAGRGVSVKSGIRGVPGIGKHR